MKTLRNSFLLPVLFLALCLFSSGCGSISNIQPSSEGQSTDLKPFTRIIVMPFEDKVSQKAKSPEVQARRKTGVGKFREMLAMELRASGAFSEVLTEGAIQPNTLQLGGAVTRYVEGSSFARLMVGVGAGNAYFDATVEIRDAVNQRILGTILVDRNSWGGGGVFSMTQTVDTFMSEAVKKVAAQIVAAKTSGHFAPEKKK